MADAYKGLTIEFAGDTTKLSAALSKVNGEVRTANGSLLSLNRALKIDPGNLSLMGDKVQAAGTKVDATKQRVDALTQAQAKLAASGDTTSATYQRVSREIEAGQVYLAKYEKELGDARVEYAAQESALGKLGTKLDEVGTKYGAAGTAVSKAGGVVLGATAAVAAASIAAFESVDTATDEAIRKTGATGAAADALSASVRNVGASAAAAKADWSDIGDTVGSVQVKFGVTGDALESLSEQFLEFGENTGTTAADDVETVAQAMDIFNVDASQTQSVLGLLQATYQRTGVSVSTLMSDVQSNGATFQEMGLNLSQSISLMGEFEQSGYDSTQMLAAMKKATAYFTAEGKSASDGIQDLTTRIQQEGDSGEAAQEAISVFGKKAGLTFIEAAAQGKISLSDLSDSLDGYSSTVSDTFDATEDGVDHAQQAMKSLQETGATLGEALSDVMGPTLENVSGSAKSFADSIDSMTDGEKQSAGQAVIAAAAISGVVTVGGKLVSSAKDIGEGLGTAATFFAKVGGAADAAEGSIEASSVAMGVAKTGALALAGVALAAVATEYMRVQKNAENYSKATDGLNSEVKRAITLSDSAAKSTDDLTTKYSAQKVTLDAAIESQAKLSDSIKANNDSASSSIGTLSSAQSVIDTYANKTDLSTQAQGELKAAIEQVNAQCGTQYTVTDAANGKISDEQGIVQDTTAAIDAYIAKKKEQIRLDSLTDSLTQAYKDQATQIQAVNTAEDDLANTEKALKSYQDSASVDKDPLQLKSLQQDVDNATKRVDDANSALQRSQSTIDMLNGSIGATQSAVDGTASAISQFASGKSEITTTLEQYGQDLSGFSTDLESTGVSVESLQTLSSAQLMTLARSYDGTRGSIVSALGDMGIALKDYNSTPIVDKDGNITVNDTSLTDAQGNLYTWNGSTLVDKDGNAVVDDVSLTDAQGNVVTWNGSTLSPKDSTAQVDDSSLVDATIKRDDWNTGSLWDKTATAIINFVSGGGAGFGGGGGGGAFASGGIIPSHADGGAINGIVTRRTLTNVGWVGEDGAEAVISSNAGGGAIIPLSNRHYVAPFARAVAEEMAAMTPRSAQRQSAASTRTSEQNVTNSVTVNQTTKVIAADEDAYVKSTVINRALMSAVTQYL